MPERLAALAWFATLGLIAWASLSPSDPDASTRAGNSWITNAGHVPAYALLTGLTLWLAQRWWGARARTVLAIAGAGLVLGALFECVQPLVGRDANLMDMALNALGVGAAVIAWCYGWLPKRHLTYM